MHGLGNDFVVIDDLDAVRVGPTPFNAELAIKICDRRLGVGADQILWLKPPQDPSADVRMEILNSDGSIAEMCGNGIRAVALYYDQKLGGARKCSYRVETLAGLKTVEIQKGAEASLSQVTVDMGPPQLGFSGNLGEELEIQGKVLRFYEVSMGNPHAVIFVKDFSHLAIQEFGPLIEMHPRFPKRTNVEFVRVTGKNQITVKVWERGAGLTLACGTGACASAVAALAIGQVSGEVQVDLPGGCLEISWEGQGQSVYMTGPAVEVFRGEILFS